MTKRTFDRGYFTDIMAMESSPTQRQQIITERVSRISYNPKTGFWEENKSYSASNSNVLIKAARHDARKRIERAQGFTRRDANRHAGGSF